MSRLLTSPTFTASATLVRPEAGNRKEYGESIDDSEVREEMPAITVSLSREEQLALPEGLRGEETRRFWTKESSEGLGDDHVGDVWDSRGEQVRGMPGEPWFGGFVDVLGKRIEDGA